MTSIDSSILKIGNIEDIAIRFEIQPKTVKSHLNEFQMNNMVKNKDNIFYWKQS